MISFQKLKKLFIFLLVVCVCRGRGTTWRSQFFLPIMWVPGIELISSGLGASTFILWATSLALNSLLPIHMICSLQNLFHVFLGIAFSPMFLLFTSTQAVNQLINQSNELTELRPCHAFPMLCHAANNINTRCAYKKISTERHFLRYHAPLFNQLGFPL